MFPEDIYWYLHRKTSDEENIDEIHFHDGDMSCVPLPRTDTCYTMVVRDREEDGLCCACGAGYIQLQWGLGENKKWTMIQDGDFGDMIQFSLCSGEETMLYLGEGKCQNKLGRDLGHCRISHLTNYEKGCAELCSANEYCTGYAYNVYQNICLLYGYHED
eukprot:UN23628